MFKKVLVAEDIDSINYAVASVLSEMKIAHIDHAQYCDKAYILAKKALQDGNPYDLLICDLSFIPDYRDKKITSGKQLIAILKELDPNLKILVNSIEDQPQTVKQLWDTGDILAYVCKDRNGMRELKKAILEIDEGRTYNSPKIESALKQENLFVLKKFDINLLNGIANGLTQDEIQENFKQNNIIPNSKSSIEKRLKELREEFNANTNPHLIGIAKDLSLI
ncbi:DNA-binding NarL/FixJ family response regulator [Gillisia mitskevichiae]|uniref:DNA-binding NarL/FixJ family response regulator n=1 Tax=Gillisia mitskevichiae TaxID=270921 RepID=A0A495P341_9FLAO|nr:response regulator [Gillisia mitskevichiae]RKS45044.1 DNA-binding NarL/FixJ family response regulator [Gillisia mitskevichiae]